MSNTLVMIDDTDSGINYSGTWLTDNGTNDNLGNFGAPYESTSHYTRGTGSFSYTFSGTYVGIFGSSLDTTNPSRVCTVDGKTIPNNNITIVVNWIMHCEINGLTDGKHTIEVTVPTANPDGYWFDFLMYIPSASVPLDNAALMVQFAATSMTYGTGWTQHAPGTIARTTGAEMNVQFTGRSMTWMGFYLAELPFATTIGTFAIDGGSPLTFNLNGSEAQIAGVEFNQRFFTTGLLDAGQHTVKVTYNGNNDTTPLSLYNIIVQNGASANVSVGGAIGSSLPPASTTTNGGASSTGTPSPTGDSGNLGSTSDGKSHGHVGVIVGVVVGVLGFLLLLLLAFFLRRRYLRRRDGTSTANIVQPFTSAPASFAPAMSQFSATPDPSNSTEGNNAQFYSDVKTPVPADASGIAATPSVARSTQQRSQAGASRPTHQQTPSLSTFSPPDSTAPTEPEVIMMHEDSGLRLPAGGTIRPGVTVVEMPPTYSAT